MRLSEVLKTLGIKSICCNSGDARPGALFVAIKGTGVDGHVFIPDAVRKGSRVIVTQGAYPRRKRFPGTVFLSVPDTRRALGLLADAFYGQPSRRLKVVGVTGTNGKTTITYLLEALIKEAGGRPAVIGTVNYRFKNTVMPSGNTTPGPQELQPLLAKMLARGVTHVCMEVSSHALDQERTGGIRFHSAIFTNLTRDHLDYHLTFRRYFAAKAKLFGALEKRAFAVVNTDDAYGRQLARKTCARVITYGIDLPSDVRARDICFSSGKTDFTVAAGRRRARITTGLIGRHNVYNILAALAWGIKAGLSMAVMRKAIEKCAYVPGRLERIETRRPFSVYVDYAHTDDALRNVIRSLRSIASGNIIVVFGCGGDRDKTKRPKMGYVTSSLADYCIITSDNPRSEAPLSIINDIRRGIRKDNYCVVVDRAQAIKKSLAYARNGDIILVAGKGHETYQIIKTKAFPFDDRQVVRQCLRSLK